MLASKSNIDNSEGLKMLFGAAFSLIIPVYVLFNLIGKVYIDYNSITIKRLFGIRFQYFWTDIKDINQYILKFNNGNSILVTLKQMD